MTAPSPAPPPTVGGRYVLGQLIGRGGAADVFRARDELLGREVAIKMFNPGAELPPEPPTPSDAPAAEVVGDLEGGRDARHRREVLTLAGLSHPGLVTVYDVGDEEGRAYFVMQLIEGDTLGQRIRNGPLAVVDVVALGAALADALAYVHRRHVVHRDVKPGNVLLDADGRAHLSDFGIAAVQDAAPVTAAGMVIGTASYLSPEQVRGEAVGPPVDVYALGLVLLESLTGRREYPGQALEAAVARLHRAPAIPPGLPESLASLLAAMTADDPAERPAADDVVLALRGVSRDIGMEAETVLSPVLMTGATGVVGAYGPLAVGAGAPGGVGAGGVLAAGAGGSGGPTQGVPAADLAPTGASPLAVPRSRRLVALVVAAVAAVLLAGSAVTYTLLTHRDAAPVPPPATSAPALPPPPGLVAPTTTAEAATATRSRRTRTAVPTTTPRRTTTTTRVPVVPVPPVTTAVPTTAPTAAPTTTTASTRTRALGA